MSTIRHLATLMGQGKILPAIKFFEPRPKFLKWMRKTYDGRLIYDIGAGCGHVARALSDLGMEVKAIDINYRESGVGFPVEISNAEAYAYKPDSIAMICRPCHGEFAEQVIFKAWKCGVAAVLYVGLEKNFKNDLGPHFSSFKPALKNAGEEGETVLIWERIFPFVPGDS
jgi:uncharacterized UPF0146 family protein